MVNGYNVCLIFKIVRFMHTGYVSHNSGNSDISLNDIKR